MMFYVVQGDNRDSDSFSLGQDADGLPCVKALVEGGWDGREYNFVSNHTYSYEQFRQRFAPETEARQAFEAAVGNR